MEQFLTLTKIQKELHFIIIWRSDSYTLQSYHKIRKYVIRAGELVCDELYLNTLSNFNQWYTTYENKIQDKKLSC